MLRNRLLVVTVWVALALFGFYANANINSLLTTSISVPGSESAKADAIIESAFGETTEGAFSIFVTYDKNATKSEVALLQQKIKVVSAQFSNTHLVQNRAINGVLYANLQTPYDLQDASAITEKLRKSLIQIGISNAKVSGPPAIKYDVSPILEKDLQRGQIVAIAVALIFLFLTLRSIWSMLVPLIMAITIISTSIGIIYLLAHKILMVLYIPNIVELIGLGLAIDYSLLMVHRYKLDGDIKRTQRTILISGSTVAIALSTLILIPVPFMRSLGIAGVIVPLVAMAAATTLQPVLLSYLGADGPKPKFATNRFRLLATFVVKQPIAVIMISIALIAIPTSQLANLKVTPSSLSALPANLESAEAIKIATDRAGEGIISPIQVVIKLPAVSDVNMARVKLASEIAQNNDVFAVATDRSYVDQTGKIFRIFVISKNNLGDSQELVRYLREISNDFPAGTEIFIGGAPAQGFDLVEKIKQTFPLIAIFMVSLSFVLLRRFLFSFLIPIKAILLDLISIGAAIGTAVFFMNNGLGVYKLEQIEIWTLLFIFSVLFGLSMDYEVFIVSRIRESYLEKKDNKQAIIDGLANTGGVVTTAALIMICALTGFVTGHFAGLQELGVGLIAGIAIDASIIRLLLLPATMVLLGKWNWSNPRISESRTNS
ncbi:MAG: MMPL family transporter [Candidatus Nanopelagicaceae bacterium]|nr:MMPL family transporter [Candidatus Nanopelagicaceae bacterium]